MGQAAEDLLNGDVDEQTGEWLGDGPGYPRTMNPGQYNSIGGVGNNTESWDKENFTKSTKSIRKELAILIKKSIKDNPEGIESKIVNDCRQAMNTKYGKGWREQWIKKSNR